MANYDPNKDITETNRLPTADAALKTAIGSPTDAAWNGTDESATVIALLKKIALNTTPV